VFRWQCSVGGVQCSVCGVQGSGEIEIECKCKLKKMNFDDLKQKFCDIISRGNRFADQLIIRKDNK
jgi:hypothetical protein